MIQLVKCMQGKLEIKQQIDNENNNLLHIATKIGKFKLIQTLIEELGFNVNELNSEVRYLVIMKYLLIKGSKLNINSSKL